MGMIISASRRTDIPAYYADWFFNGLKQGFVLARNPMNARQVSKIPLSPEAVDCVVFWTKNPQPMLAGLRRLAAYPFYFQFTLNAYGEDIETRLPGKNELIGAFIRLAGLAGPDRVLWRYDPILLNGRYTLAYHIEHFEKIARALRGHTKKATISFITLYSKIREPARRLNMRAPSPGEKDMLAGNLSNIARENNLLLEACAGERGWPAYGVLPARCIDGDLIAKLSGRCITAAKDKNQRPACGCAASVDIGAYNTCLNGCLYCYANRGPGVAEKNMKNHDPASPLLTGHIRGHDVIHERAGPGGKAAQGCLFSGELT
ncbi:MAG: DUF1848 domain-containing protein [Treponema sp.]|nr:DUF1848 domain-containing protein [Treponema sp.]